MQIEDENDKGVILEELYEVANDRLKHGEEFIRSTNFAGAESQLFMILLNLIECSDLVFHGKYIHNYIAKFVETLKLSPGFADIFQQRIGIEIKSLPDEALIEIVLNFAQIERWVLGLCMHFFTFYIDLSLIYSGDAD